MSRRADLQSVYAVFESWAPGVPVYGPGEEPVPLEPSGDPASPSRYVAWRFTELGKARISVGTSWADRAITVRAWGLEADRPEDYLLDLLDSAAEHVYNNAPAGFTFLQNEELEDEQTTKSGYYGRGLQIPYLKPEAVVNG